VVTISAADFVNVLDLVFGFRAASNSFNLSADIAQISVYPDSAATIALAEAAAAEAISATGYTL
jgi:hypothetical protein